jgi:ferric-dicitrate binding protein FerR (iron transport regulator)
MKNQDYQNIENLLEDDTFCKWVKGVAGDADKSSWETWLASNPQHEILLAQAKTVLLALKKTEMNLVEEEINAEAFRILQAIDYSETPKGAFLSPRWWKIAASIALLAAISFWFLGKNKPIPPPSVSEANLMQIIDIQNVKNDTTFQLQDGSRVQLRKGSSIQFDKKFFMTQRTVNLINGEAFFEVATNKDSPFVVYANDIVTKVLGTSFIVRTSNTTEGGVSSVVVRTGRVAVFNKTEFTKPATEAKDSILLFPNQQVSRKVTVTPLIASLVETPVLIEKPVKNPSFTFDNAPIVDILATLEKAYSVQIEANENILKNCRLTISLGNQDELFDKLKVICKVIGAHYEVVDTKIKLTGKGC